ncbi:exopolyphosphatase [Serpentinimonas maccroryi]|jgi:exopolyphosphatase/guanosine-5'-triphosphate,3'-diphosphate pyrophosphatase|uniref:Exopolyphosphatase n=1 Tax=Serpentinimonas maccroryi TaxID=1458426 RepID=A0A060NP72_9BURK|nr:Ppx/GppA phosphatase family protein [Serpentinimonas maccroryi]OYX59784.1 MAG: exopolyphosphatase [Comamonadaceae bacterium 32-67-11]BAO83577.1 exopolyphosphatase [Serpentinimonas maccroryi]
MDNGTLLAAVDLGSNSFRLEVGRYDSGHVARVDYIKEPVRLGAGLDEYKNLSLAAMERGWECLARFGERLQGFKKTQVRAVATQTLREARNRDDFMRKAQAVLGFAIDVISGHEEARLIYQGASHLLPQSDERRLVIDIGGRSTEIILGLGYEPLRLESYRLGSVSWTQRYFARGQFTTPMLRTAVIAAKAVLDEALDTFPAAEWKLAYGSSGSAGAVCEILALNGFEPDVITRPGLDWLTERLLRAGNVSDLRLEGLRDDRRPVLCGGLSVLHTLFELFDLQVLHRSYGALRQGALFDLIDRESDQTDIRERTVRWLGARYAVDQAQAERVAALAVRLFAQVADEDPLNGRYSRKLDWAARLHEIGTHISHEQSYRHGAYILDHVDAPGFSLPELHRMSRLVLGQRGKLRKIEPELQEELFAKQLLCLRLAVLLCHARKDPDTAALRLGYKANRFKFSSVPGWSKRYPQSAWLLEEEALAWQKTHWALDLDLR